MPSNFSETFQVKDGVIKHGARRQNEEEPIAASPAAPSLTATLPRISSPITCPLFLSQMSQDTPMDESR